MCGLVGMIGRPFEADKKAFRSMLMFDYERGKDSTGLAVVTDREELTLLKELGHPAFLMRNNTDFFTDTGVWKKGSSKVFIGHNRAATKGKVTKENAHPFHHNTVVGAHNGTLVSTYPLENGHKFDVDSEAIFYNLDKYEAPSVIADIHGAYALTWYDFTEKKLKIIRNDQRPLYWSRREDKDVLFWASEEWMLHVALGKNNIKYTDPELFEKDTLYEFDLTSTEFSKFRAVDWVKTADVKGYVPQHKPKKTTHTTHQTTTTPSQTTTTGSQRTPITNGAGTNTGSEARSNVVPFRKQNINATIDPSTSDGKARIAAMRAEEGNILTFRFSGLKKGVSGAEYLAAYPDSPLIDFDIRVFAGGHLKFKKWKEMTHTTVFRGKVKRLVKNTHRGKVEAYLLIDLRTLEEVRTEAAPEAKKNPFPPQTDEDRKIPTVDELLTDAQGKVEEASGLLYKGFNNEYMSPKEWEARTECGCAGCMSPADSTDDGLVWIDPNNFLCGSCATVDFYKSFLPNFGS